MIDNSILNSIDKYHKIGKDGVEADLRKKGIPEPEINGAMTYLHYAQIASQNQKNGMSPHEAGMQFVRDMATVEFLSQPENKRVLDALSLL